MCVDFIFFNAEALDSVEVWSVPSVWLHLCTV